MMLKRATLHSLLLASLLCSTHVYGTDIPDIALSEDELNYARTFAATHPALGVNIQENQTSQEFQAKFIERLSKNPTLRYTFLESYNHKFNQKHYDPYQNLNDDNPLNRTIAAFIASSSIGATICELESDQEDEFYTSLSSIIDTPYEPAFKSDFERALLDKVYSFVFMWGIRDRFGDRHETYRRYCVNAINHGAATPPYYAALMGTPHEAAITSQLEADMASQYFRSSFVNSLRERLGEADETYQRYCLMAIQKGDLDPDHFAALFGTPHEAVIASQLDTAMAERHFTYRYLHSLGKRTKDNPEYQRLCANAISKVDTEPLYYAALIDTPYEKEVSSKLEEAMDKPHFRKYFLSEIRERLGQSHKTYQNYCAVAIKKGDDDSLYFSAIVGTEHETTLNLQFEKAMANSSFRREFMFRIGQRFGESHDAYVRYCAVAIRKGDTDPPYYAALMGNQQLETAMEDKRFRDNFISRIPEPFGRNQDTYQRCCAAAIKYGDLNPVYFIALIGTPHEASIASRLEEAMADENFRYNILQWMPQHNEQKYAAFLRYCAIAIKYGDRTPPYFAALIGTPHEEVTTPYLEDLMADAHFREHFIEKLANRLGLEDPKVQQYIHMALGFDNAGNPNSFLAVHQEMLRKREDAVQHNMTQLTPGLQHKLDVIQEARKDKSIHMPLNAWHYLFEQLQQVVQHTQGAFSHLMGDVNITDLLALRENQQIASLLDPKDSLVANTKVSAHSQMLREVLQNIRGVSATQLREEGEFGVNLSAFLQLLVNIQTCPTGKLNGIAHSYIYMNQGRVLDESLLGTEGFKREIVDYFKEELRRKREATLTLMLKNGLRLPNADPHDVYYVRGIIGSEVGLLLENETPLIDINANGVSSGVRSLSKQQLLDLFYQYYKVEDVVSIVHEMLNNNTIQVSAGQKNLTLRIINEFLQGEAFDPDADLYKSKYVVTNAKGEPTGLTLEAAKALLAMLGIVEVTQAQ